MTFLTLSSGCANTSANSFCLWFEPITISQEEFDTLSEHTLRQIDGINSEYKAQCIK